MTNTIIKQFNKDFSELQQLSVEAEKLQKQFIKAAEKFNKKYRDAIFKSTAPKNTSYDYSGNIRETNSEWALQNINPWHHNFSFNLYKVHRKCNFKLTQIEEYTSIDNFNNLLEFTGENINQRIQRADEQ